MPLDTSQDRLDGLLARPSESLNVEIKQWLDPKTVEGISKISRAAMALRNRNGGYLVIGLTDKDLLPALENRPADVRSAFSVDVIQSIVSKYSYPPFEIEVGFGFIDGLEYPIIAIPDGVTVPVACRRDLLSSEGKNVLAEDAVYFRTLSSNGSPSTSRAKAADWREIVDICFENREIDIGRFLRKHVGSRVDMVSLLLNQPLDDQSPKARALRFMSSSKKFRDESLAARLSDSEKSFVAKAGQYSVSLIFDPPREFDNSDTDFLNAVSGANPQYTGWPAWLDSRRFSDEASRPQKIEKAWQALIWSFGRDFASHADFLRMHARGEFYLWRILQDDMTDKVDPFTRLDVALVIYRVAEIFAVGLAFAKAFGLPAGSKLGFAFKWLNVGNRELDSWANPRRLPPYGYKSFDNEIESFTEIDADVSAQAIAPYVVSATKDLLAAFDGFSISINVVESIVSELFRR